MYEHHFEGLDGTAAGWRAAAGEAASAYLDGKPRQRGKHKITAAQRDAAFWACPAWMQMSPAVWRDEAPGLALVRYFSQESVSHSALLARIASDCPDAIVLAVRRSRLAVRATSARRLELDVLGSHMPVLAELRRVLDIFDAAYRLRIDEVARCRLPLEAVPPFELLVLISLYAFEHLVPWSMSSASRDEASRAEEQAVWGAMNDILWWKLRTSVAVSFRLDKRAIGQALSVHLAPVLNGAGGSQPLRAALAELVAAQSELNAFLSRSVNAFCFDDGIRFVRRGTFLEIEEVDAGMRAAWTRDGRKLERLHEYWFYRAAESFATSPMAMARIGRPENHEANRLAWIRALRTRMQLTEVYGVDATVTTDAGEPVDLFQVLLASELNSAFFQRDFLEVYVGHLRTSGNWTLALRLLAQGGALLGLQNRLPLTWSERSEKVRNLVGWTVTDLEPAGNVLVAGRILDFWSSDWEALAERARGSAGSLPRPELFERPYLKFGSMLVQLPWLAGVQNNSTAALNNLRRLGLRRGEYRAETANIETRLGAAFTRRGFAVVLNWAPPRGEQGEDPGEVDVICARDGMVLVLEVKSTFLRQSSHEAWVHASTTLRKAGRQLSRKVAAVRVALAQGVGPREEGDAAGPTLAQRLGVRAATWPDAELEPELHGWIVDTSIESDHQRFHGFLKVSLEEMLIALRDDASLLHDPQGLFSTDSNGADALNVAPGSLYPRGFSARGFLAAVTSEAVWTGI